MTPRPRPDDAARAEELFTIYEAAWPEPVLRREWKTVTQIERVMWIAVARCADAAVAEAVKERDAEWDRREGAEHCPTCHGRRLDRMAMHLEAEVEESDRVKELRDDIRRTRESAQNLSNLPSQEEAQALVAEARREERAVIVKAADAEAQSSDLVQRDEWNAGYKAALRWVTRTFGPPASAPEGEPR